MFVYDFIFEMNHVFDCLFSCFWEEQFERKKEAIEEKKSNQKYVRVLLWEDLAEFEYELIFGYYKQQKKIKINKHSRFQI